ncbi:MAG: universal stress protein [Nitrospirae bacterium]|nr:universal stress protein [Nitrospirota bacterium]
MEKERDVTEKMRSHCILAGIDLGPDTEKIISYAACFSAGMSSAIRLLYVIDYLLTPPTYLMPYIAEEQKRDEEELQRWKAVLEKQDISSDARIMMGRLHESFVKAIEEFSPDLLVIGYQSHAFRPSSSERLIKSLEMPMLVVRGARADRPGSRAVKKILCAVDFSENAQKAVAKASDYAQVFSADLHIVHSIPSHTIKSRWAVWETFGEADKEQFDTQMQAEAEAELSRMIKRSGGQHAGEVLHGNPAETICSVAEEGGYDLVVMGARGLSYIQGLLIGSTTESVLRSSPCPVLIVH